MSLVNVTISPVLLRRGVVASGNVVPVTAYSITIFLPHGEPTGLRIARRSHWSGEVLMCPRTLYPAIAGRPEFARTGAYVLVGPAEDGSGSNCVYIGESDNVRTRMKDHDLKKTFWDDLVVITKTDGSLHKADVRYLEARLFELAVRSPLAVVENVKKPMPPQPTEAHKADLDSFLEDVLAILRLLGVSTFSTGPRPAAAPTNLIPPAPTVPASPTAVTGEFFFSFGGATGRMTATADGFVLHAGEGVVRADKLSIGATYKALRQKLLDKDALVPIAGKPDHLRLVEDLPLRSPSAAGAILYGGNVNGRTQWKDVTGRTLAEREAAAVDDVQSHLLAEEAGSQSRRIELA